MKYIYFLTLLLLSITINAQIIWEPTSLSALCPSILVSGSGEFYAGDMTGNFWKSTDNAENWTSVNIGVSFPITDIAEASNGDLFITTGTDDEGNGVYKSIDGGATWQHCAMTAGVVARDVKIKPGIIFVSTKDNGLGKSTDMGVTWSGASSSVPESNVGAFSITNNGTLLLSVKGSNGIYRSTDNGATWSITNFPQSKRVYSLTVASNNFIFAGTKEMYDGVYKSTDDGATWNKIPGLPQDVEYSTNGFSASDGNIYLGVINKGVYCSTDFGDTWQLYDQGFQNLFGFKLAEGSDGTIYATTGAGVYKSTGSTSVKNGLTNPVEFVLEQNYPNPFNPSTKINYNLPVQQNVSLKIYDMLGNEISALVNENQEAGVYQVSFNASHLGSGVYFYKLETENFSETKSMLLIK